jgi:hypothetical protein
MGVLSKKITVPEGEDYKEPNVGLAFLIVVLMIGVCLMATLSCNPTKRAYKAIEKLPPITNNDSSRLAKRSLSTFPVKPPVIKEGKEEVIKEKDSTDFYKKLLAVAESKKPLTQIQIQTKYKDTCTSAQTIYKEGYGLGYEIGFYDGKSQCPPPTRQVDTFEVIPPAYQVDLDSWKLKTSKATAEAAVLKDKVDTKNKRITWLIIALALAVVGNVLQFKFRR